MRVFNATHTFSFFAPPATADLFKIHPGVSAFDFSFHEKKYINFPLAFLWVAKLKMRFPGICEEEKFITIYKEIIHALAPRSVALSSLHRKYFKLVKSDLMVSSEIGNTEKIKISNYCVASGSLQSAHSKRVLTSLPNRISKVTTW